MRLTATTSGFAALLATTVLVAPSAVAADSTIGATAEPDNPCGDDFTVFQVASPGGSYAAPTDGVVTSWRTRGGQLPSTRTLKIGRGTASQLTVLATGTPATVPAGTLVSQDVRIPVEAGDFLGFYIGANSQGSGCATTASDAHGYVSYAGQDLQPGPAPVSTTEDGVGYALDVAATLEPDADGDGFGDTTQDACPTQAQTQGACTDRTAPRTRITSSRAGTVKRGAAKARVTIAFAADEAATFACSVDGAAYRKCNSPLVRKLGVGRHTVKVRATDAAGNTDASPAVAKVMVKRAR